MLAVIQGIIPRVLTNSAGCYLRVVQQFITAIVCRATAEPDHQATRVGGGGFIKLRSRPPKSSEHLREDVDRRVV
ncbi:MAG: hypothetical protein WCI09_12865, partial [Planctomycetota bacterium]